MTECPNCGEHVCGYPTEPLVHHTGGVAVYHDEAEHMVHLPYTGEPTEAVLATLHFDSWWFPALHLVTHVWYVGVHTKVRKPAAGSGKLSDWSDLYGEHAKYPTAIKASQVACELLADMRDRAATVRVKGNDDELEQARAVNAALTAFKAAGAEMCAALTIETLLGAMRLKDETSK